MQKKEYENPQQLQEKYNEEYLYRVGSVEVSDLKRIGQFKKNRRFQKWTTILIILEAVMWRPGGTAISIYVARVVATKSYTNNNIVIVHSIYILPNIKE